jgi:hypothetical protein
MAANPCGVPDGWAKPDDPCEGHRIFTGINFTASSPPWREIRRLKWVNRFHFRI